jgi:restriction endonuclease S subunit/fido (protein-threonine AMPylation protein)
VVGRWDCPFYKPEHHTLELRIKRSGYKVYKLGDSFIATNIVDGPFGSDLKVEDYVERGIPLIRVSNCKTGRIARDDELVYITPAKHQDLIRSEVLPGDVLLTKAGHILGYTAVFPPELERGNITSHLVTIRPSLNVLSEFLATYLSSTIGVHQIYRWGNKATRPELNTDEVRQLLIPLPPLNIQKKLVDEMGMAREFRKTKLQKADELLGGLDEWLLHNLGLKTLSTSVPNVFAIKFSQCKKGRLDVSNFQNAHIANPRSLRGKYPNAKLADLAHIIMGQAPPGEDYNEEKRGIPLLAGAADLGEVNPSPKKWTLSAPKQCQPNDIILCIRATIGNLNWADRIYALGRGVAGIRPKRNIIFSEYLFEALHMRRFYLAACGTGSTFKQVIAAQLNNCPIPLPPVEVQREIATEIIHRREEARRLRAEAEAEWAAAKVHFEAQLLGGKNGEPVAINAGKWQTKYKEESHDEGRDKESSAKAARLAKKPRGHKRTEKGISGEDSGLGGKVHGIRAGAGEYDAAEGTSGSGEDSTRPVDSTRYFETAQGKKTYSEVAEIVAVSVARTIESVIALEPRNIHITPEWICKLHHDIAASLFPDWAGHFRLVDVKVGTHSPPSFYEVPVLMRLYCEDLAARLSHVSAEKDIERIAETLAFSDWRFQWIHPFRDFNGRVGRIILTAILFILNLPPAETAAVDPKEKERYLNALRASDDGNMSPLTRIWVQRLLAAIEEN